MAVTFQIFSSAEIDKSKWDNCIHACEEGLIYSTYNYLDALCDNWSGVVIDDYKAVMPLPWRKKYGIKYFYEPPFIQQLGLINSFEINSNALYETLIQFAKYGDINLNFANNILAQQLQATHKTNFIIDLSKSYEAIIANYKKDLFNNLKKAHRDSISISTETEIELAIDVYQSHYQSRISHITSADYNNLKKLCASLVVNGSCFTRKVLNNNQELLCIGLFLKDSKRIYNLLNTTTAIGRRSEANHYLLDGVIKEFCGQDLIFDFEGSDLPGVKNFYEKFGAVNQPYFHYHFNKLPAILRWLKR